MRRKGSVKTVYERGTEWGLTPDAEINRLNAELEKERAACQELRALANERLQERDRMWEIAHAAWNFIQDGCFFDDLEMGELDSPERELWCASW
jgi:hypothetical protein